MRVLRAGLAFLAGGLICAGMTGCEPGNEPTKLDSAPATGANGGPPPRNQADYYKAQQEKQKSGGMYGKDYPGAQNR